MKANYDRTEEQVQLLTEQLSRQTEIDQLLQSIDTSGKTTLLSILNAPTDTVYVVLPMESVQPVTE